MVWAAGHTLQNGRFTIQDVLGQGGFGITYEALHTRLNTFVVIKTPNEYLKYDPDYDKYVDRFIKEGQRLAQLSQNPHPHVVRVWDLFEEGEIPCMVMDFVPGENLFQLVRRRGALPETEIVPCIRQIGEALSAIHQARLVHRDAHPGNIIVRPDARAILIDFGIAKEVISSRQSSTGIAGNQGFAPYEQLIRGSREPTVDVYCLAATLYFAVTGERPVTSLERRLNDATLIAPRELNPTLSEYLNQAILKGMALEARNRPQSMQKWLTLTVQPVRLPPRSISWKNLACVLAPFIVIGTLLNTSSSTVAVAGMLALSGSSTVVVTIALALVEVEAETGTKLQESFSQPYTFLILTGTSLAGLDIGWLIGTTLRSSGFVLPIFGML